MQLEIYLRSEDRRSWTRQISKKGKVDICCRNSLQACKQIFYKKTALTIENDDITCYRKQAIVRVTFFHDIAKKYLPYIG